MNTQQIQQQISNKQNTEHNTDIKQHNKHDTINTH